MEKRVTKNALETQKYAEKLAKTLKKGDTLLLYGDLGSGKTTFVQGLAKALEITQRILSPTFIIMRSYNLKGKGPRVKGEEMRFYHVDLYRTQTPHDIEALGLWEIIGEKNNIVVIEWPERLGAMLPKQRKKIFFRYISEQEREIIYE